MNNRSWKYRRYPSLKRKFTWWKTGSNQDQYTCIYIGGRDIEYAVVVCAQRGLTVAVELVLCVVLLVLGIHFVHTIAKKMSSGSHDDVWWRNSSLLWVGLNLPYSWFKFLYPLVFVQVYGMHSVIWSVKLLNCHEISIFILHLWL